MDELWNLNLIRFLTFYFTIMFLAGTWRRIRQYSELGKLVLRGPQRWPRLLKLISEHRMIFLTWRTVAPAGIAFGLTLAQWLAAHFLPEASLTVGDLIEGFVDWPFTLLVSASFVLGLGVLAVDLYFFISVGDIDRPELEKYFDQAEYWLASRTAHVVNFFTLGIVNPRRMVAEEVRKALEQASDLVNNTLWWVSLQLGLRFFFGLALWIAWAVREA